MRILKEPLLHFFVLGFVIFLAFGYAGNEEESDAARTIIVERENLIDFLQFRDKLIERTSAEIRFDQMPNEEIQSLIDEYVENGETG